MAKAFEKRVSKRNRKKIDLETNLDYDIFKVNDDKLLRGAELQKVKLKDITVRKQVRTKFEDDTIKDLAANIKENGLIQPLVLHRENDKFVLICGERRFRAMSTIKKMTEAPCFILEDKNHEELMAIQFSENSSREALHYIDQADSIMAYKKTTGSSERKIQSSLGISKSEVHRCLQIAKLPSSVKEAAKDFNIEKYVLLEWSKIKNRKKKKEIQSLIVSGELTKRSQLKEMISIEDTKIDRKTKSLVKNLTALDNQTRLQLKEMLERSLD